MSLTVDNVSYNTVQKMKLSIKDFFSECDQNLRKLRIWSHLLKKPLVENLIFCAVQNENLWRLKTSKDKNIESHQNFTGSYKILCNRRNDPIFFYLIILSANHISLKESQLPNTVQKTKRRC